ncbi:uncharacterized protein C8A04DRAFT_31118 [Dichotomopilus funicola]|uniref:Uncharacterized protein n=1 Tax=Dichotomopilus funicola TaxID=1934379 RepID=A0AAN6ZL70_9PEZI|nr:hypothetical protein C8A04DRAFT_31118 [Dichotomopilus funicola]
MFVAKVIAAAVVLTHGVLGEGIHLLNCSPFGAAGNTRIWYSLVAYCENDADCSSLGYVIPSNDRCIVSTSTTPDSFHTWEGGPQNCTFPTGITFGWNIPANAQSKPDFSSVGGGWNDFRSFDGYKDNKANGAGLAFHSCRKIYYYV